MTRSIVMKWVHHGVAPMRSPAEIRATTVVSDVTLSLRSIKVIVKPQKRTKCFFLKSKVWFG